MTTITHCQSCGKDLQESIEVEDDLAYMVTCSHLECERFVLDKMRAFGDADVGPFDTPCEGP